MGERPPVPPPVLKVTTASSDGTVVVASDAVLTAIDRLNRMAERLSSLGRQLRDQLERADLQPTVFNLAPYAAIEAHRLLGDAVRIVDSARHRAERISESISRALRTYSHVEGGVESALHGVEQFGAWQLGFDTLLLTGPVLATLWPVIASGVESSKTSLFGGVGTEIESGLQGFLKRHPALLNNPFSVAAIRETASNVDLFEAGLVGLPPGIATALDRAGVLGVKSAASEVINVGRVGGMFEETPVTVRITSTTEAVRPPTSLVDRSKSFPSAADEPNGEQIRIDRYEIPGQGPRFDVFIGGTATFDPKATTQPFDLTSDVQGVAGRSAGSVRAVELAMAKAGITPETPVVLNGYSQGGLVASVVAASGRYNVDGVVTFGAPSGQVRLPSDVKVLSVRNTEDLVTALGGYDTNPNAVVVQRSLFPDGNPPTGDPVVAHRLSYYQQTAAVVDQADSSEVRGVLDQVNHFASGAIGVKSTLWVATRTPQH